MDAATREMLLSDSAVKEALRKAGSKGLSDPLVQNQIHLVALVKLPKETAEEVPAQVKKWAADPEMQARVQAEVGKPSSPMEYLQVGLEAVRPHAARAYGALQAATANLPGTMNWIMENGAPIMRRATFVVAGVGFARAALDGILVWRIFTTPGRYTVNIFQLVFSAVTMLFESPPEMIRQHEQAALIKDRLLDWAKFLTLAWGRGAFYLFQGSLWIMGSVILVQDEDKPCETQRLMYSLRCNATDTGLAAVSAKYEITWLTLLVGLSLYILGLMNIFVKLGFLPHHLVATHEPGGVHLRSSPEPVGAAGFSVELQDRASVRAVPSGRAWKSPAIEVPRSPSEAEKSPAVDTLCSRAVELRTDLMALLDFLATGLPQPVRSALPDRDGVTPYVPFIAPEASPVARAVGKQAAELEREFKETMEELSRVRERKPQHPLPYLVPRNAGP